MDWVIAILVGAFIGWLASVLMRTNAQQGVIADILVGMVGAALGRGIFAGLIGVEGAEEAGGLSLGGILWGVVGAALLIAILRGLNVFRTTRT
ncbi:MAG: GlsB/YeaQ/YmgE family stress response membrane protein [Myxococcota bacterium]